MLGDTTTLALATALSWAMVMTASALRVKVWEARGMRLAFGNRDDLPTPTPIAGRADRAAKNMLENLVFFVALVCAARFSNASREQVDLGANIFLWARVAYFPIYVLGVRHLRSVAWAIGLVGLGIIASSLRGAVG